MGWWKARDTECLIGDLPLDALGKAMSEVVEQYQANFNRRPTVGEWEALLRTVLSAPDDEFRMFDDGVAKSVRIELESVEDYWRRVTAP